MLERDIQGLLGGGLLVALGLFTTWYAHDHYALGNVARMGPGYLPVILGGVLALLGLIVAVPAWRRPGTSIRAEWANAGFVVASIVLFGLLLPRLGLVVATLAAALVALVPDRRLAWSTKCKVAVSIAAITYLIFVAALGMTLPAWPWSG